MGYSLFVSESMEPAAVAKRGVVTGSEFRSLRLGVMLTPPKIAKLIGVSRHAIYKWEKGARPVPRMARLALQMLYAHRRNTVEEIDRLSLAEEKNENGQGR